MQLQRPNNKDHIALVYQIFTQQDYNDEAYKEIIKHLNNNAFNLKYTYAIYTDQCMVKENIFLPIFHTYYLNSAPKKVILRQDGCFDLPLVYPYHEYYIYRSLSDVENVVQQLEKASPKTKITIIDSLKDICNELQ